jgi:hypothetical protein
MTPVRSNHPAAQPALGRPLQQSVLTVEQRMAAMTQQVDALAARVAELEASAVRQGADGRIALPKPDRFDLDVGGARVLVEWGGVRLQAPATLTLAASSARVEAGMVAVHAGMLKADGVVQCNTLIANAVNAASYSPGAGNVW